MPTFLALGALAAALSLGSLRQEPDGKAIFDTHCKKCHGPTGRPSAAMKKLLPELPVWDGSFFARRSDDQIVQVLMNGKGRNMKPFRDVLSTEQMLSVAKYIRTLVP